MSQMASFLYYRLSLSSGPPTGYVFQRKDVLLTATFTLALEGMTNITSLTLPAFDASLLAHHSAFELKQLTFTNYTLSESDAKVLRLTLRYIHNVDSVVVYQVIVRQAKLSSL